MKEIEFDISKTLRDEPKKKERSKGSAQAPALRTYRADVEELIEEKGASKADVVAAEAARRESRGEKRALHDDEPSHLGRLVAMLLFAFVFIFGVGFYALFVKGSRPSEEPAPERAETVAAAEIIISDSPREQILADISLAFGKTSLPKGKTRQVLFFLNEAGDVRDARADEFLRRVSYTPPSDALLRSLAGDIRYVIYSDADLSGVLVLKSRSYASTFAEMLEWEPRLSEDLLLSLRPWFNRKDLPLITGRKWKDRMIGNMDARVLSDSIGNTILAYTFIDKTTLVISSGTEAIAAISAGTFILDR